MAYRYPALMIAAASALLPPALEAKAQGAGDFAAASRLLAKERELGHTCAGIVKAYGTPEQQIGARIVYSRAKAGFDGFIEGLLVALSSPGGADRPVDMAEAEAGVAAREELCERAMRVVPDDEGQKSPLTELLVGGLAGTADEIAKSLVDVYRIRVELDQTERNGIASRLKAQKWPGFDTVPPAS